MSDMSHVRHSVADSPTSLGQIRFEDLHTVSDMHGIRAHKEYLIEYIVAENWGVANEINDDLDYIESQLKYLRPQTLFEINRLTEEEFERFKELYIEYRRSFHSSQFREKLVMEFTFKMVQFIQTLDSELSQDFQHSVDTVDTVDPVEYKPLRF